MFAFNGAIMLEEYKKLAPEMVTQMMSALLENDRPIYRGRIPKTAQYFI